MGQTYTLSVEALKKNLKKDYYCYFAHELSKIMADNYKLLDYFEVRKCDDELLNEKVANLCRHYTMMVQTLLRLNLIKSSRDIEIRIIAKLSADDSAIESHLVKNMLFLKAKYFTAIKEGIYPTRTFASKYMKFLRKQHEGFAFMHFNPFEFEIGDIVPFYSTLQNSKIQKITRPLIDNSVTTYYTISELTTNQAYIMIQELARPGIVIFS